MLHLCHASLLLQSISKNELYVRNFPKIAARMSLNCFPSAQRDLRRRRLLTFTKSADETAVKRDTCEKRRESGRTGRNCNSAPWHGGETTLPPRSRTNSAIPALVIRSTTRRRKYIFTTRAREPHASRLIKHRLAIVLTNLQHCASHYHLSFVTLLLKSRLEAGDTSYLSLAPARLHENRLKRAASRETVPIRRNVNELTFVNFSQLILIVFRKPRRFNRD